MGILIFQNQEKSYLAWITAHRNGYVLNTLTKPSNEYLVLHSASCATISKRKKGAHPACFTGNGYIKICADSVEELHAWAEKQGFDSITNTCEICHPSALPGSRRLDWTRDELILALDLYHRVPQARNNERHPGVVELSELLQELPIHPVQHRRPSFRNPNGVAMKLGNFKAFDPNYLGSGLRQGGALEQKIWNEYANNLEKLRADSIAIREHYPYVVAQGVQVLEDDGVEEGGILHASHRLYERDASVIRKKKKDVFEKHMALKCEVCEFDFAEVYGELGHQFAECHHNKPVSKMKPGDKTKQSDLSIVCANCHRMLHRDRELLSVAGLKALLAKERALTATKGTFK